MTGHHWRVIPPILLLATLTGSAPAPPGSAVVVDSWHRPPPWEAWHLKVTGDEHGDLRGMYGYRDVGRGVYDRCVIGDLLEECAAPRGSFVITQDRPALPPNEAWREAKAKITGERHEQ